MNNHAYQQKKLKRDIIGASTMRPSSRSTSSSHIRGNKSQNSSPDKDHSQKL